MTGRYRREGAIALALLLLLGALALYDRAFFEPGHLLSVLVGNAPLLVAAVGMTLVILCRQIDVSVGSQYSLCAVLAGLLAREGLPLPAVAAGAVLAGAALGAVNGTLVTALRLPSIVVTLATLVIGRESLRWLREGAFVRDLPPGFQWFGLGQQWGQAAVVAVALAVTLAFALGLRYLPLGRAVYATGSDEEAARLAGIRPRWVIAGVFVLMGALAGLASLLNAVRFVDVDPNAGAGLELQVIAAVVVGGTAVSGGRGRVLGSLLGVALLATLRPALVFLGTQAQWEKALQGVIILLAVAADATGREGRA